MKILVLNAGSSSLKYQLFNMNNGDVLAKGLCECIGGKGGSVTHKYADNKHVIETELEDHEKALSIVLDMLLSDEHGVISSIDEIGAVGHRVAHGGEKLKASSLIDDEVVKYLEGIVPINPLHGPPAIKGITACRRLMSSVPQVAVFDTSFYSQMEDFRTIYPIPYELYTKYQIRRYGFHGTSHRYVAAKAAELLNKPIEELKIVTCHLGNGSSITAVDKGIAIDTSMGFTPQEGLPMGTRSGSIDPTVIPYIMKAENLSPDEVEDLLNRKSGLLGISGVSNDCRQIAEAAENGNYRAKLAQKILVNSIKKIIGSYVAELNGIDALVFTAGIGENDAALREAVCEDMDFFGIKIDKELNKTLRGAQKDISTADAKVKTMIIPTNEEYMIALDTLKFCKE
ncbi:MAG: acetate kinase [Ruminococcaceae bacterium]|nr:acetate kinase [Oscillospiraceae bacterium]